MISFLQLALAHSAHWEVYLASFVLGAGVGFAFASMANLIVEAVRADQTGCRDRHERGHADDRRRRRRPGRGEHPGREHRRRRVSRRSSGYTVSFLFMAAMLAAAVVASFAVPGRVRGRAHQVSLGSRRHRWTEVRVTPRFAQIALCTTDVPRSVQLYTEVFGFADAGGRALWGERIARMQALGDDTAFVFWWLVGRQDMLQLELFHHTTPRQRAVARQGAERPRLVAIRDRRAGLRSCPGAARRPRDRAPLRAAHPRRPAASLLPRPLHRRRRRGAGGGRGHSRRDQAAVLRPRPAPSSTRRSRCPTSPSRGASSSRRSASPRSRRPSSTRRSSRRSGASRARGGRASWPAAATCTSRSSPTASLPGDRSPTTTCSATAAS